MKASHWLLVVAIVGLVFFLLFKRTTKKIQIDPVETEVVELPAPPVQTSEPPPVVVAKSSDPTIAAPSAKPATDPAEEILAVRFSEYLTQMGKCIGLVNMVPPAAKVSPVADKLVESIRSSLGEAVLQMEDWSQKEVIEKDGTVRRIRVDFDYPDGATPMRRLSLFNINSYGAAELMELTADESNNPNVAYIQSLSEGLKVTSDEQAGRVYFSQGEELMFTVKNGKLQNFSVTRANKNFSCADMDNESSRCICP